MNSYQWKDLKEEMEESFTVTVTETMLEAFYKITGDCNPMHRSDTYAREKGYQEKLLSSCTNIQIHPVQADFSKEEQIEKLISIIKEKRRSYTYTSLCRTLFFL